MCVCLCDRVQVRVCVCARVCMRGPYSMSWEGLTWLIARGWAYAGLHVASLRFSMCHVVPYAGFITWR